MSIITNTWSVSQLNQQVSALLDGAMPAMWIEGEIANLAMPRSGHCYFTLKDSKAQIRCALFRQHAMRLTFGLESGQAVRLLAKVSLYQARGDYQLIVERVEATGTGVLQQALLKLQNKLNTEGLFAEEHKQLLPELPKTIGLITSATGAALRDLLTVLSRRCPHIKIIIYPSLVQGHQAAPAIVRAIATANERNECDVLIIARGGGSLEDLWPFNEEMVVRAIYLSNLAIITGIGHETDTTLSDLAADQRAATPSAAAELVSAHSRELIHKMHQLLQQANNLINRQIQQQSQRVSYLYQQMQQYHPQPKLQKYQQQLTNSWQIMQQTIKQKIQLQKNLLQRFASELELLSPLKVVARGYCIASDDKNKIVNSCAQVRAGDKLKLKVSDGEIDCDIVKVLVTPTKQV